LFGFRVGLPTTVASIPLTIEENSGGILMRLAILGLVFATVCSSAVGQTIRPPVTLLSFNLPPNFVPGGQLAAERVLGSSQYQLNAMQLLIQVRTLREECTRLPLAPSGRQAIVLAANLSVQRAEALHQASVRNNFAALPALRASLRGSLDALTRSVQLYLGGNPGLRQAIAQVEFAEQRLDGGNGGGIGGGNEQRESAARLAYAVESQSEQLRAAIADASNFGTDANMARALRNYAFGYRRLAESIETGIAIQQALSAYTALVEQWRGIVNAIGASFATNVIVQTQAARTNSLTADLGRVLGGAEQPLPPGPGLFPSRRCMVVGAGETGGPHVKLVHELNGPSHDFFAYDVQYRGGVRVAVADLNGDGTPDIVTAPGRGMIPLIRVFNGRDLSLMAQFVAYDPPFDLGVYVAAADLTPNGRALIAVGPGVGGPPHVKLFDLAAGRMISELYPYPRELRCGARPALGDINRDGLPELVTVPGAGNGPHVKIFNGADGALLREFSAVEESFRGGLFVAMADVTRNGRADLILGTDAGRVAVLKVVDGVTGRELGAVEPFGRNESGGVRVGTFDVNADGIMDLIAAPGAGVAGLPVRIYNGANSRLLHEFVPFQGNFAGGVFVGGK